MKVFVTGATGYIGSAVTRELINAGHQVVGLARSDEAAAKLKAVGVEVHRGNIEDLDSLRSGAITSDGVINVAFNNSGLRTDFAAAVQAERRAIETMGEALVGTDKPFVIVSGTGASPESGQIGTEEDEPNVDPSSPLALRGLSQKAALSFANRNVRASVVGLPLSVHDGKTDKHGFIPSLIAIAQAKGVSAYVGEGTNRWPAVHVLDAAHLFRLALEKGSAGSKYHGAGDEGVAFRDIAEAIGKHLKLPITSISRNEATEHFGFLGSIVSLDRPASSTITQKQLGWHPEHPGLIEDLDQGHYFETQTTV